MLNIKVVPKGFSLNRFHFIINFISDYELLEVSSDEEGNNSSRLADEKDYVPPSYAVSSINTGKYL
jgi:hypothetical protein